MTAEESGNLVISTSPKEPSFMKSSWSSQGRRLKSASLRTTGRILAENEQTVSSLDRNILVWEIKLGGRLSLEWKEVLNKNSMKPLLSGRGGIQRSSAQVEELICWAENYHSKETQLIRETRNCNKINNCNRRIQLHLKISSWRTVKRTQWRRS